MALAEGAAAGILAAEANRRAFEHQRAEGQRFGEGPVDRAVLRDDLAALLDEAAQLGMQVEILGELVMPRITRSMTGWLTAVRGQKPPISSFGTALSSCSS